MLQVAPTEDGLDRKVAEFGTRRRVLEDADRYFYLQATTGPVNHRVTMSDGREMVMLASYSYLGLIGHPAIDAAAKAAIDAYGTGAGGVRLLTGTSDLHERLEARIAAFARRADACVYSSGYATNVAIITALVGPGDLVLMDKLDHASIVDGCLLSGAKWRTYRHNDMDHLEKLLRDAEGRFGTVLVVADSVFSMDGDIMDLPRTKELCERFGARLMVDEAHSIGALGATAIVAAAGDGRQFRKARYLAALGRLARRHRPRHRRALRHGRLDRPQDGHTVQVDTKRRWLLCGIS